MNKLQVYIKKERLRRVMTQSDFANFLGISKATLAKIESGSEVGGLVLSKISNALNVSVIKLKGLMVREYKN